MLFDEAYPEEEVLKALASASGLEFSPILSTPPPEVLACMPRPVAIRFAVVPLATMPDEDSLSPALRIAISDPLNFDLIDNLHFTLRREIEFVVAPAGEIRRLIAEVYPEPEA